MSTILPDLIEAADAAASISTTYSLTVGQSAQGAISSIGDHDWYRINLSAGQTYTFAQIGTGTNALHDTYLNLRDSNGNIIASDDDSGPGASSLITFTAATSGAYYIDAGAYSNQSTGQYGVSVTAGAHASFDIPMAGGAIDANDTWGTRGSAVTVTYGFRASPASYTVSGSNITTFSECSAAEMAAVQNILQEWSAVCNVNFVQVNPGGYTDSATILIGNYNDPNDGAGAFTFYPGSTASTSSAGDLWLNVGGGISTSSIPVGSYSYLAILHELGHAIGLSHPGDYNAAAGVNITYSQFAQFIQDSEQYSVMSYFGGSNTGENPGGFGTAYTPMMFDIYEAQQLYGANMTTRTGDTTYGFHANAGSLYAFTTSSLPQYCIWDAGGNDTLDCSGYNGNQVINLNAGTFSNIDGGTGNISIAIGATIENAIGGGGNDTFYLSSANVNDLINGSGGTDTVYLQYAYGRGYSIQAGSTATNLVMLGSEGTDTFLNVESFHFIDGTTVSAATLLTSISPVVIESSGATTLTAVGANYSMTTGGTTVSVKYAGTPITSGQFGGWIPIGAEKVGSGYDIAWKISGQDQYSVWGTDSNGNYTGNILGAVSGANSTLVSLETTFQQDLNGDGTIGPVAPLGTVIESTGLTTLTAVGTNFHLNTAGVDVVLKFNGVAVTAGQFGGWTPIGAEKVGAGYDIAWKITGQDQYSVWGTDSNGNYTGNILGAVPGANSTLISLETTFQQDLNGDGTIGPVAPLGTTIESAGLTTLTAVGTNFHLNTAGVDVVLKFKGVAVTAGQFGGWTPIGAEKVGSGYDIAWKISGQDQYSVWGTDSNGNYTGNILGAVPGANSTLISLETTFQQDLNGDGTIGAPAPIIQSNDGFVFNDRAALDKLSTVLNGGVSDYWPSEKIASSTNELVSLFQTAHMNSAETAAPHNAVDIQSILTGWLQHHLPVLPGVSDFHLL